MPRRRWSTQDFDLRGPQNATVGVRQTLTCRAHETPSRHLQGLAERRRDLRKTKDDIQDNRLASRHAPQCSSYSIRPLYPAIRGKTTTSTPPLMCAAPPCDYKRRRRASFRRDASRRDPSSLTLRHPYSPPSTPLLAETWEPSSLSRLACIHYYKHVGCKIIQCPRTPPLLDVRPRGRNQDKPCVTVLPLASSSGTRKHAAFTRWDPDPRVGTPTKCLFNSSPT